MNLPSVYKDLLLQLAKRPISQANVAVLLGSDWETGARCYIHGIAQFQLDL